MHFLIHMETNSQVGCVSMSSYACVLIVPISDSLNPFLGLPMCNAGPWVSVSLPRCQGSQTQDAKLTPRENLFARTEFGSPNHCVGS